MNPHNLQKSLFLIYIMFRYVVALLALGLVVLPAFSQQDIVWSFTKHVSTVLHPTDDNYAFSILANDDLLIVKKTGVVATEVHILTAASDYTTYRLQTVTGLHPTDSSFEFTTLPNGDLVAIKKVGVPTAEVHVLTAASNYKDFSVHEKTAFAANGVEFDFGILPNGDLVGIKKNGAPTVEVHILSAESKYKQFTLHAATALAPSDGTFVFRVLPNADLVAIKRSSTVSNSTEVHVLSAISNYKEFTLHTGTALHETPIGFDFAVPSINRLFAIKKSAFGLTNTEVHVLEAPKAAVNSTLQPPVELPRVELGWADIPPCEKIEWNQVYNATRTSAPQRLYGYMNIDQNALVNAKVHIEQCSVVATAATGLAAILGSPVAATVTFKGAFEQCIKAKGVAGAFTNTISLSAEAQCMW